MGHREIKNESTRRRKSISLLLRFLYDDVVFYLQVTPFFTRSRGDLVYLNVVCIFATGLKKGESRGQMSLKLGKFICSRIKKNY
jgi:hypothetical protein